MCDLLHATSTETCTLLSHLSEERVKLVNDFSQKILPKLSAVNDFLTGR